MDNFTLNRSLTPTPEPGSLALLGTGLLLLGLAFRRHASSPWRMWRFSGTPLRHRSGCAGWQSARMAAQDQSARPKGGG
ncbi:MAG: PEP-CTERM sorting domain-containing protein, partial [Terriglobales bacterium]